MNIFELPIAQVLVDKARILERLTDVVAFNLRIDVSVDLHDVGPAVVVVVEEAAAPGDVAIVDSDAG